MNKITSGAVKLKGGGGGFAIITRNVGPSGGGILHMIFKTSHLQPQLLISM